METIGYNILTWQYDAIAGCEPENSKISTNVPPPPRKNICTNIMTTDRHGRHH